MITRKSNKAADTYGEPCRAHRRSPPALETMEKMKKLIIGFLVGFIIAFILAIPIVRFASKEKYKFGYSNGVLNGQNEMIYFLSKHFEVKYPPSNHTDSLINKPGGIFVIRENGVVTIQTIRY